MGKLYYNYGTMNSSKTANLLMMAYNYESVGRQILCLKSNLDNRWSEGANTGKIMSRVNIVPRDCYMLGSDVNLFDFIQEKSIALSGSNKGVVAVFVDEAQFLTKEQVKQLSDVAINLNIDILCYGLKNSYVEGELFEGSAALLYYADEINCIVTICKFCEQRATMNLRLLNGKPIYNGNQVQIGDVESNTEGMYVQVCTEHYKNPVLGSNT